MTVTLTIDCMGGDHGPSVTVPAAVHFVRSHPDAHLQLVGIETAIRAQLKKLKAQDLPALSVVPATEVVEMDDPVEVALRKKKDSSMRVALNRVKEGEAQACVSAGNTGALMAVSRYVLKTLPGIERPAIAFALPNPRGYTTMLDLGANVDCEPQHLLQFAEMGHALVAALEGKDRPTIGLLNIGEEVIKGNETIKRAGELLRASTLNFRGNVEGNDIYKGSVDVIVCDGFVGNVALKTSEGLAQMLNDMIKEEFGRSWFTKLMAIAALPVLMRFKKRVDHRQYNGAALLGLKSLVIKSHGSADAYAFECAINRGYDAVKNGVLERLTRAMEDNAGSIEPAAGSQSAAVSTPDSPAASATASAPGQAADAAQPVPPAATPTSKASSSKA
ncbi:phosphate:acyl-[acyl carrier protein] acyltransferase [Paraburkholderia eburnea]|uniref:Phosphate acyltransferase n=1 Tax=Paraburkholderia eburnea TaxID=1189126 RepID=A0A2S4M312_9BURK|nr:phosphate acyltransferase PlsX [Paraburkholderia eburnea]POR49027.1 phosphate:acyl-[acyl carrier protein] acyltransferase [Paraburkholderia eburnea]PRZ19404.1 phosphate:acyl-[acyl carrier protein] acyltransferase [Paraburkholderia eburnea]